MPGKKSFEQSFPAHNESVEIRKTLKVIGYLNRRFAEIPREPTVEVPPEVVNAFVEEMQPTIKPIKDSLEICYEMPVFRLKDSP